MSQLENRNSNRFGTSRGPVRDALLRLTQEGVLVYEANKGVGVNSPLSDEEEVSLWKCGFIWKNFVWRNFSLTDASDFDQISILLERLSSVCNRAHSVAECDRLFTGIGSLKLHLIRKHLAWFKCPNDYEVLKINEP